MTQIHYFPRYSQRENFQTNNTLLLLHRLYDFSRLRFERFLSELFRLADIDTGSALVLGLQIKQQIHTGKSVVDGYLHQDSFRIAIETKQRTADFAPDQLSRHLSAFADSNGGFLFLLSPKRAEIRGTKLEKILDDANRRNVILVPVTFENIIDAARGCLNNYDEEMLALVTDYEDFCSEEGLLPVDQWTLFVPPCGQSHEINVANQLYFCPASWSRRKAQYFGVYYNKAVRHIGKIAKVVECDVKDDNVTNETTPLTDDERQRIIRASSAAQKQREWNISTGYQFFLCDDMSDTMFQKSSRGGIMGHRYFDLRAYLTEDVLAQSTTIAEGLQGRQWKEI